MSDFKENMKILGESFKRMVSKLKLMILEVDIHP